MEAKTKCKRNIAKHAGLFCNPSDDASFRHFLQPEVSIDLILSMLIIYEVKLILIFLSSKTWHNLDSVVSRKKVLNIILAIFEIFLSFLSEGAGRLISRLMLNFQYFGFLRLLIHTVETTT